MPARRKKKKDLKIFEKNVNDANYNNRLFKEGLRHEMSKINGG